MKKVPSSHELTPLHIKNGTIPSYTFTLNSKQSVENIEIRNTDLSLFTFQQWNMYLSRTILYPYAAVFAAFYSMTPGQFSYIMSAFDFGGILAVFLTLSPKFNKIGIRSCMFIILIMSSIVNFGMTIWSTFGVLFVLRMLTGLFATIGSAQIRGTIGVTLKDRANENQSRLTFGVMLIESAWSTATFGWMFIGIALHRVSVNFAWYSISGTTLLAAVFCYFLPTFSIYDATPISTNRQIMTPSSVSSVSSFSVFIDNNNTNIKNIGNKTDDKTVSISTAFSYRNAYDLYVLYLGMFANGIPFYCFFSTFGAFMQSTFDLNPEQLGAITLTITAAEISALISSSCIAKFKSNMFTVILGSCCGLIVFSVFIICLNYELLTIFAAMTILYLFTYTIELSYLNSIVCTLHFSPPGYESTSSLIGQFVSRSSSIFAVIMGVHIVEWIGFQFLIEMLVIVQFISILVFWWLYRLYSKKIKQSEEKEIV